MAEKPYSVTYNGFTPWGTGITGSAPFVSYDVQEVWSDGQLGFIRTVTLNGTIPSGGVNQITGIKAVFARNFQAFSAPNISIPVAMVEEMSFSPQNYFGKVDYSITLRDFSGFTQRVNNPTDEVSFVYEPDGSVTVNHKVSAVGVDSNANQSTAFQNAKSFVIARTGLNTINSLTTSFVSQINIANIFCLAQQETIDRVNTSYGIVESFKYDPLRNATGGTFKRFSLEVSSGINDDYIQVSVNGSYRVGKDVYNTGLFAQVSASELLVLAQAAVPTVNTNPVSFSVESEEIGQPTMGYARNINIRALYDTLPQLSFFEYDIEASQDYHNGITQIGVRGQIIGSGRHVRRKFDSALSFFNSVIGGMNSTIPFLYQAAHSGAVAFGYNHYAFNPIPKSFNVVLNSGQGTINMAATFDDAPFVTGYAEFNWDTSIQCGLNVFRPHASVNTNGVYIIQDLGILNRTSVNINGSFTYQATGALFIETNHLGMRRLLMNLEGTDNAYVENETYNISKGDAIKSGFTYNYTKDKNSLSALPDDGKIFLGTRI